MERREPRLSILIQSEVRSDATWRNAWIFNLSTRGMALQASSPPARGTYIEVRRGQHTIVARVVWVNGARFGVRSQDPVPVEAMLCNLEPLKAVCRDARDRQGAKRTRAVPSISCQHEKSRMTGRAFEFACLVALGGSAALVAVGLCKQALERPLASLGAALAQDHED